MVYDGDRVRSNEKKGVVYVILLSRQQERLHYLYYEVDRGRFVFDVEMV